MFIVYNEQLLNKYEYISQLDSIYKLTIEDL